MIDLKLLNDTIYGLFFITTVTTESKFAPKNIANKVISRQLFFLGGGDKQQNYYKCIFLFNFILSLFMLLNAVFPN